MIVQIQRKRSGVNELHKRICSFSTTSHRYRAMKWILYFFAPKKNANKFTEVKFPTFPKTFAK